MNDALFATSNGEMMMTFFAARIDKATGMMTYSNASHETPMVLPGNVQTPTLASFVDILENNNPRLGQQPNYSYTESTYQLGKGDRIFFYTDGAYDIQNAEGRELGQRRLMKLVAGAFTTEVEPRGSLEYLVKEIRGWRADTSLRDDVTMILVRYGQTG